MSYNHTAEENAFKKKWEQKEEFYRENGMTEEQISAIKEYDEKAFKLDRAFYRRTLILESPETLVEGKEDDLSATYLEEYWTELIDDEDAYNELMKIRPIMRKAYYMHKVLGMYQFEISSELSISQQVISYWIGKIAEILK